MKKKGFTLIELLAVIVILAIIALIVTPVVSNIIESAKNSANARSVEGHIKNIELAIISKAFTSVNDDLSIYDMVEGELESLNLELPNGDEISCESYTINDGIVTEAVDCIDGVKKWKNIYDYTNVSGAYNSGVAGQIRYKITYNLDGGILETSNPLKYDEEDTFTLNNPTKEGYVFIGWSGTGLDGNENMTVTIPKGSSGKRNYTANYQHVTYTITYMGGTNGTGTMNPIADIEPGSEITLPDCKFIRNGYTISKWVDQNNNKYDVGNIITVNENMTLTVEWKKAPAILYDEGPVAGYTWTTKLNAGSSTDVSTGRVCPSNYSWGSATWILKSFDFTGYSNFHAIITTKTFKKSHKFIVNYGATSSTARIITTYNVSSMDRVQVDGTIGNIGVQNLNLEFGYGTCDFYVHKVWLD